MRLPDTELGGKALRQFVLRAHRLFKMIEAVRANEQHMRQIKKRCHAVVCAAPRFPTQRIDQDIAGARVVFWQETPQRCRDMPRARHQFAGFVAVKRRSGEAVHVELRMHLRDGLRNAFWHVGAEAVFQRLSHGAGSLAGNRCASSGLRCS
jgi:hypothetical protein